MHTGKVVDELTASTIVNEERISMRNRNLCIKVAIFDDGPSNLLVHFSWVEGALWIPLEFMY